MRQQYDKTKIFCIALVFVLGASLLADLARIFGADGSGMREEETAAGNSADVAVYVEGQTAGALAAAGSGVILAADEDALWVVTAGHVLERAAKEPSGEMHSGEKQSGKEQFGKEHSGEEHPVKVEFGDGSIVECQRYERVKDADLAFLCILKEDLPEKLRECPAADTDKESYDALEAGAAICLTGYQDGRPCTFSGVLSEPWIYVADFEQYMMVAVCEMESGMSGGGLYDEAGHLIGIACGGNGQGELAAVPLHVVWARFEELRK